MARPVQQIPGLAEEAEWHGMIPPETHFELPSWIQSAWQALAADEGLATAVNAHYEAVRLDRGHPSVAHLIHVAAIEGIGASFVKGRGVARKRFREALETVMTEAEAEKLAGLAYDLRCATGHTGDLLGSEHTFGYPLGLLFQQTDDLIFDYAILGRLRQASRRVLTKALQDACAPGSST